MRLGVISDTHLDSPNPTLQKIVRDHFHEVDMIVHLGDYVDYSVAGYLMDQTEFVGVTGNMDPPRIRHTFPPKRVLELGGFRIGMIHGWGAPFGLERRIRSEFGDIDAILYGHTHQAANHHKQGILFFNPGSACRAFFGKPSVGILWVDDTIRGEIISV